MATPPDIEPNLSLVIRDESGRTTLVDAALFLAILNLPKNSVTSTSAIDAAGTLLNDDIAIAPDTIDVESAEAREQLDLAQPVPGLDLTDGAAWLVSAAIARPTDASVVKGMNALLGTPGTPRELERIPGARVAPLPGNGGSSVTFEGVPDRLSLFGSETLPGDIIFKGRPDLSPIASVVVELNPRDNLGTSRRRQVPIETLDKNYGCSPDATECMVPASATLTLFEDNAIPALGSYSLEVSTLDEQDVPIDETSQDIELTF